MAEGKRSSSTSRGKKKKVKASKETLKEISAERLENEVGQADTSVEKAKVVERETEVSLGDRKEDHSVNFEDKTTEPIRARLSDEYLIQCYFDKSQNQFVASVLEFGHIKATGTSKSDVIRDCENRIESHLNLMKRQGEPLPESFQTRHYPESLQIPISQGLYRRLDLLSRQEKTSLDQLVVELLSGMVEKRLQSPSKHPQHGGGHRPQQHSQSQNHRDGHRDNHREGHRDGHREGRRDGHRDTPREPRRENHRDFSDEDNIGNLKGGPQPGQNRGNRNRGGRNFHKTMESRENFLEYVRNLEKGNWKKR